MTKIRIIRFKHIPTDDRNINFIVLFNSKGNLLVYVIKDVNHSVSLKQPIQSWKHYETKTISRFYLEVFLRKYQYFRFYKH